MYILSDHSQNRTGYSSIENAVRAYIAAEGRGDHPQLSGPGGPIEFRSSPRGLRNAGYSVKEIANQFTVIFNCN